MADAEFYMRPGMSRAGTLHLVNKGATVLGTDAEISMDYGGGAPGLRRKVSEGSSPKHSL